MSRINDEDNVSRIELTDGEGKVLPLNILVYSSSGGGKSVSGEEIFEMYHRNGFTCISLSDVKDELEQGFSMFEPESMYHIRKIRRYGSPTYSIPTKIYHPFTFNIPKQKLPNINFFTINIRDINRIDLNFLAESSENKKSIQILLDEISKLKKHEGLHHLVYYSENQTESIANLSKSKVRFRSDNAEDFFTKSKVGTEKTSGEITSYFKPFLQDYCIAPEICKINIDIKEIMNDQRHYHIFTYKWIKDRRLKSFFILHLINELINNADNAKHPIMLYIEEIRFLVPQTSDGYIAYLAEELKNTLTRMRNMGKGYGTIMTTQVYRDTNEKVVDTCNEIIIGRLSSWKEYDFIGKSLRLTTTEVNLLKSIDVGEFVIKTRDEFSEEPTLQKIKLFMPPHAHKDQGYNFFDMYKKKYPTEMRYYKDTIEYMEETKQKIIIEVGILKDKENETKKQQIKKEKEYKEDKDKMRLKIELAKVTKKTDKKEEIDERMKQLIYQEYERATGKEKSSRSIAKKLKMYLSDNITPNHTAVLKIINEKKQNNIPNINKSETQENIEEEDTEDTEEFVDTSIYNDNDTE